MSLKNHVLILFLAISGFASNSEAGELSDAYYSQYKLALATLTRIDISRLGSTRDGKLAELNHRLFEAVNFVEVDNINKPNGATRFSAFSDCKTNTVYINRKKNSEVTMGIVLHEALGALCIEDVNYQISSVLSILIQMHTSNNPWIHRSYSSYHADRHMDFWSESLRILNGGDSYKKSLVETLDKQANIHSQNQVAAVGGSGTIIGEAGDAVAQEIKVKVIVKFVNRDLLSPNGGMFFNRRLFRITNLMVIERVKANKLSYVIKESKESKWKNRYYFYVPESMSVKDAAIKISDFMVGL